MKFTNFTHTPYYTKIFSDQLSDLTQEILSFLKNKPGFDILSGRLYLSLESQELLENCKLLDQLCNRLDLKIKKATLLKFFQTDKYPHIDLPMSKSRVLQIPLLNCKNSTTVIYELRKDAVPVVFYWSPLYSHDDCTEVDRFNLDESLIVWYPFGYIHKVFLGDNVPRISLRCELENP